MRFEPTGRQFQWLARVALLAFAILFLPMDPGQHVIKVAVGEPLPEAFQPKTADYPQIVKMNPARGDIDVDPAVQREISVTFDRDMTKGMSWTGKPPLFPEINGDLPIRWLDQRTCVLPVKLKKGTYYRVGINATGFHNFQSTAGVPTPPTVIAFVTKGASDEVKQRVKVPKIVSLAPEDGAKDVDPETRTLRVTFNMPMGEGMSWTGGGASMPKTPSDKGPSWSKDGKTCTLPVLFKPSHDYRLGLNDLMHNNFQSVWGIPLEPVEYRFHTREAAK